MKFLAAIACALLSVAGLLFAIDSSGSLQDAPPIHGQTVWMLPYALGFLVFGVISVVLFVQLARRGL